MTKLPNRYRDGAWLDDGLTWSIDDMRALMRLVGDAHDLSNVCAYLGRSPTNVVSAVSKHGWAVPEAWRNAKELEQREEDEWKSGALDRTDALMVAVHKQPVQLKQKRRIRP